MNPLSFPTIMIIDDEQMIIDSLLTYLDDEGFKAEGFTVPEEALQKLRIVPPDICIVDLRLPGINGEQLIKEILLSTTGISCMIYTGAMYSISDELKGLGMTQEDVIEKPIQDFDRLTEQLLSRRK